jgi:hypothetical protein
MTGEDTQTHMFEIAPKQRIGFVPPDPEGGIVPRRLGRGVPAWRWA